MKRIFLMISLLIAAGAASAGGNDLDTLFDWMSGSFSSAAQAAEDPDFYHITLEMAPVWAERAGEHWLYVEQAVAATKDKPYRQRVYRLRALADGTIESAVYLLPNPEDVVGAWKGSGLLNGVSPEDLELRTGCSVFLKRVDESRFAGATSGSECASSLRGAAYATSEVTISEDGIESWDQGFDAAGKQVWGAEKGGYIFDRQ